MHETELGFLLALVRFQKIGAVRMAKLRNYFSDMQEAFCAPPGEWISAGIEPSVAEAFASSRSHLDPEKELALLAQNQVTAIPFGDPRYPPLLAEIFDPPAILFLRGSLPSTSLPHLAVVGSRKHTPYGKQVIETLLPPVVQSCVIVSGLALGIDALAHEAALSHAGTTVAVLGSGVDDDNIYPSQNRLLASRMLASGGALLSEFPLGTHALKHHFPFRNRIIAGLCHGTLIIEAAEQSGTLITARLAMEHNREVFAVPGPINSTASAGANRLIKEGATPVLNPQDLLEPLGITGNAPARMMFTPDTSEERVVFDLLHAEPIHIDELIRTLQLPAAQISQTLSLLELKGGIRHVGGKFYVRN